MSLFFISFIICSYSEVWGHLFSSNPDNVPSNFISAANKYYISKYHIWYGSFSYYNLLLFFLIPVITSGIYAEPYYKQSDVYNIYRQGFKKYYIKKFFKAVASLFAVVGIPLCLYWLILNIFPTTNKILIEGVNSGVDKSVSGLVSTLYIGDSSIRNLAVNNPDGYVYYTMFIFIISGVVYGIYSYALGNFIRSRIFRYFAPFILLSIFGFLLGMVISDSSGSIVFDTFNTAALLSSKSIIIYNLCLLLFSLLLLIVHYKKRSKEG